MSEAVQSINSRRQGGTTVAEGSKVVFCKMQQRLVAESQDNTRPTKKQGDLTWGYERLPDTPMNRVICLVLFCLDYRPEDDYGRRGDLAHWGLYYGIFSITRVLWLMALP